MKHLYAKDSRANEGEENERKQSEEPQLRRPLISDPVPYVEPMTLEKVKSRAQLRSEIAELMRKNNYDHRSALIFLRRSVNLRESFQLRLTPENAFDWHDMGKCHLKLRQHKEAEKAFQNAIEIGTLSRASEEWMVVFRHSMAVAIDMQGGRCTEALNLFREVERKYKELGINNAFSMSASRSIELILNSIVQPERQGSESSFPDIFYVPSDHTA